MERIGDTWIGSHPLKYVGGRVSELQTECLGITGWDQGGRDQENGRPEFFSHGHDVSVAKNTNEQTNAAIKQLWLSLSFARCGAHFLSIRRRDVSRISAVGSVLCRQCLEPSRCHRVSSWCASSRCLEDRCGGPISNPQLVIFAAFVLHVEIEPHMRICPIDLCNSSGHLHCLVGIKFRSERMVCHQRHACRKQGRLRSSNPPRCCFIVDLLEYVCLTRRKMTF